MSGANDPLWIIDTAFTYSRLPAMLGGQVGVEHGSQDYILSKGYPI